MSALFESNRNLYHTFSRVAIQEGQGVAAAVNKTGHTVTTNDVWSDIDKLPKNTTYFGNAGAAFTDLKAVYDADVNYAKYVKLYENATLTPVSGSGQDAGKNQAWELLVDGKRVKNFVAPTDVFDADGQPCNGYTLHLYDAKGTEVAPTDGNWAFDYVAGLVIFERGKTPQDKVWPGSVALGDTITITAWAYAGGYLSANLTNINEDITGINEDITGINEDITGINEDITGINEDITGINEDITGIKESLGNVGQTLMAVKPFTWEADTAMIDAVLVDEANPIINGVEVPAGSKYIEVPAVVFNVFNAATGVAYGDINYIAGGKTLIVFEDWNDEMFGGEKTFVAYGFVLGNGNPITVLESSTLTKPQVQ